MGSRNAATRGRHGSRGLTVEIESLRTATPEEWDRHWGECGSAAYFHSREWAEAWSRYESGLIVPDARLVTFTDGVQAVLPVSRRRSSGRRRGLTLSSPAGTYGGWLGGEGVEDTHAALLTEALRGLSPDLAWRVNPFDERALTATPADAVPETTHVLDLSDGFETLERGFSRGHRSAANKARRVEVRVDRAVDESQWRAYFDVYRASRRRWGSAPEGGYQWSLFAELSALDSRHVDLWLALLDETVICGALVLTSANVSCYWHGAALAEYFSLRPATLLMCETVRAACAAGQRWFDFGPSADLAGVVAFKERFGTQVLACPEVTRSSRATRFDQTLKKIARRGGVGRRRRVDDAEDR